MPATCFLERLRPPGVPVDGIVGVLKEIGGGGLR
ncbi:hypothetical protein SFR_4770 [Streptomyces sp. FR-008]|nr:hypothetical protein SFR_4770 [Streptomyces sp. FR-008]